MTHHNQTKELITWLLNLPLDESIDNKKLKIWSSNPKHHEAQLEDQKSQEKLKRSSKRRKIAKASKRQKSGKPRKRAKKISKSENSTLPLKSTPPNTLNASSPS
jgi:hypothetical protein